MYYIFEGDIICEDDLIEAIKQDIHPNDYEALIDVVGFGNLELVKYLVSQGADIHLKDDFALIKSACHGHFELLKYFVEQGANIHTKDECALMWSAKHGHLEIVEYLVEKGADINMAIKYCGCSKTINLLKKYLKKQLYKGQINDQTETDCGICLTEMNSKKQEIIQCKRCKKCIHHECSLKWDKGNCVYCRN